MQRFSYLYIPTSFNIWLVLQFWYPKFFISLLTSILISCINALDMIDVIIDVNYDMIVDIVAIMGFSTKENLSILIIHCNFSIATRGVKFIENEFDCQLDILGWMETRNLRWSTKMIYLYILWLRVAMKKLQRMVVMDTFSFGVCHFNFGASTSLNQISLTSTKYKLFAKFPNYLCS